jgi:hypothetical protein
VTLRAAMSQHGDETPLFSGLCFFSHRIPGCFINDGRVRTPNITKNIVRRA